MQAVWVEIPVHDLDRALAFYRQVFGLGEIQARQDEVRRFATLIDETRAGRLGISLTQTQHFEPSRKGPLVFLSAGDDLDGALARVSAAGGTLVEPRTSMGEFGSYASFLDTEGNLLALYTYP